MASNLTCLMSAARNRELSVLSTIELARLYLKCLESFYDHSKNSKMQDNCEYVKSSNDGIPAYPKMAIESSIFFLVYISAAPERVFSAARVRSYDILG
jgi:hypothetical protein